MWDIPVETHTHVLLLQIRRCYQLVRPIGYRTCHITCGTPSLKPPVKGTLGHDDTFTFETS